MDVGAVAADRAKREEWSALCHRLESLILKMTLHPIDAEFKFDGLNILYFDGATHEEIFRQIKEKQISNINMSRIFLTELVYSRVNRQPTAIKNFLSLIPDCVTEINLTNNKLGCFGLSGVRTILSGIPKHVKKVNLSDNNLDRLNLDMFISKDGTNKLIWKKEQSIGVVIPALVSGMRQGLFNFNTINLVLQFITGNNRPLSQYTQYALKESSTEYNTLRRLGAYDGWFLSSHSLVKNVATSHLYGAWELSLINAISSYLTERKEIKDENGNPKQYFGDFFPHLVEYNLKQQEKAFDALKSAVRNRNADGSIHLSAENLAVLEHGDLGRVVYAYINRSYDKPVSLGEFLTNHTNMHKQTLSQNLQAIQ